MFFLKERKKYENVNLFLRAIDYYIKYILLYFCGESDWSWFCRWNLLSILCVCACVLCSFDLKWIVNCNLFALSPPFRISKPSHPKEKNITLIHPILPPMKTLSLWLPSLLLKTKKKELQNLGHFSANQLAPHFSSSIWQANALILLFD